MLGIGKIISSVIGKNLDAEHETQLMQIEIDAKTGDTQTIEELHIPGYQYKPHPEALGFFSKIHEAWKVLTGIDDTVTKDPSVLPGESKLYSHDAAGVVIAVIRIKTDGTILIENGTGSITFDALRHTHLGNLGYDTGPPTVGAPVPPPATPPSTNASGDIIDGSGTNVSTHLHSQGVDAPSGDTQQNTSTPI